MIQIDSISVLPPADSVNMIGAAVIGGLAALGSGLIAKGAGAVDTLIGSVDGKVRHVVGPALPLVTAAWAIALPAIGQAIGVTNLPPADVVATAPLAAVFGVTLREVARKWVAPLVRRVL